MDVNMQCLFGSGEYLRAQHLSDSSATSINVTPTFHEEELRLCVCSAPRRKIDADEMLDELRWDEDAVIDYFLAVLYVQQSIVWNAGVTFGQIWVVLPGLDVGQ